MLNFRALFRALRKDSGGNAILLVAMGLPALIGASGLAVDVAQWYMWKNELQYAADQAAIAGAWARTDTTTQDNYVARARQEFTANLSSTSSIASTPAVSLTTISSTAVNAVAVTASATRTLPFSGFVMSRGVTVSVSAAATFAAGQAYTSCILATDPTASGSVTISGTSTLTAGCGIASLSTSASSIVVNGNPDIDAGWVISKGGIDDWFNLNAHTEVHEYLSGLYDPFASLTPPTNTTPRTYSCQPATTTTKASVSETTTIAYKYYMGKNQNDALKNSAVNYSGAKVGTTSTTSETSKTVSNGTVAGSSSSSYDTKTLVEDHGNSSNNVFEVKTTTTATTYSNVVVSSTPAQATVLAGTYSGGFKVSCTTVLNGGVYVIDGGGVDIDGQNDVTGAGVMFVLKNGAYIKINGGSSVTLTAMNTTQLTALGLSSTTAAGLDGMLVFEDRNSSGSNKTNINGNSSTVLNGTLYFPVSTVDFGGTATVTSRCLMIAANKIKIAGTANMSTFCPPGMSTTTNVSGATPGVKLVA
ncbi:MAG: pilus assembly protein TadG-related protein [Novosphingobium sp.]